MAKMIPNWLLPTTESKAEKLLYVEFEKQLPDEFVVFHSRWWQVRDVRKGAIDGEVDFIIAHPNLGILFLDVKGGSIQYEPGINAWYQNNRPMKESPFEQVQRNKRYLLKHLKEIPYFRSLYFNVGHAVAFPDVHVPQERLRLDAPHKIILDNTQLSNLLRWVDVVFEHYKGQGKEEIGKKGIEVK